MRRLILLRHAKSSWSDIDLHDHDRPLSLRGRLAAPLIGAWLAEQGYTPDHVMCSSSRRTIETWARARLMLAAPDPVIDPKLYHAGPEILLHALRAVPDAAASVMIVGHQPGIGAFARKLANATTPPGCARAFCKFPTAACAVLDLSAQTWSEAAFGSARFHGFAIPRELV